MNADIQFGLIAYTSKAQEPSLKYQTRMENIHLGNYEIQIKFCNLLEPQPSNDTSNIKVREHWSMVIAWLTSCLTGLDSTKQVNLLIIFT